jgi:hypothetical protein
MSKGELFIVFMIVLRPYAQDRRDLWLKVINLICDLQFSGYSQGFIDSVIRSKGSSRQKKKEEKPLGTVYIPYKGHL